jgi:Fe-S-cluster-containing dehydrogenase component
VPRQKTGTVDQSRSRIQIVGSEADGFELALCRQCADPKCVTVCPAAALTKNYANGVIDWNADKCVDCLLCTVGCAYAGIAARCRHGSRRQVRYLRWMRRLACRPARTMR